MKHIRFYDLRHSCASLLLANSVSLREIQEWLGRLDYGTATNIYSHLEYNAKLDSADKIAEQLILGKTERESDNISDDELDGFDDSGDE